MSCILDTEYIRLYCIYFLPLFWPKDHAYSTVLITFENGKSYRQYYTLLTKQYSNINTYHTVLKQINKLWIPASTLLYSLLDIPHHVQDLHLHTTGQREWKADHLRPTKTKKGKGERGGKAGMKGIGGKEGQLMKWRAWLRNQSYAKTTAHSMAGNTQPYEVKGVEI